MRQNNETKKMRQIDSEQTLEQPAFDRTIKFDSHEPGIPEFKNQ
jgi:hypothetical protein